MRLSHTRGENVKIKQEISTNSEGNKSQNTTSKYTNINKDSNSNSIGNNTKPDMTKRKKCLQL